jgi:four helix bundle protein
MQATKFVSFQDLDVWQRAVDLAAAIDPLTDHLVRARRFPMASQLWRATLSISSNIAEGNGRVHRMEYAHHVSIARGSLMEVQSILCVAIRCNHLSVNDCARAFELIDAVGRMLTQLLRALYRARDLIPKARG